MLLPKFCRPFFVVAFIFSAVFYSLAQTTKLVGKVVAVTEGDTITIQDKKKRQHKIKLAGIDAPEPGQAFYERAQIFLSTQIMGQTVVVEGQGYDSNGHLIGKLLVAGRDMSLEMLISGFAWHFKEYAPRQTDRDRQLYESAEFYARKAKFNLWSDPAPVAPWQYDPSKPAATAASGTVPKPLEMVPLADTSKQAKPAPEMPAPTLSRSGEILGNKNSKIYHWEGCPGYTRVDEKNRVFFKTRAEAETAGYRAAKNCKN